MAQPPVIIDGIWFDAGSSRARSGRLTVAEPSALEACIDLADGEFLEARIASISDRVGTLERQIVMHNGGTFSTPDNASVDRLTALKRGWFSRVSPLETFHPRLIALIAAVVALIAAAIVYGLPVAAKVAAWATPPEFVHYMDRSALSTLDTVMVGPTKMEPERRERLRAAFRDLVAASGHEANFRLLFRDGGAIGPNALALPAGTIIVTDQLVSLGSDEEVIAVLAHEISHVQHEHSLQQLYRALGFAGLISVIAGDLGAVAEEVLGGGGIMLAMAASREMELEADAEAIALLRKVNADPAHLLGILNKLYASLCKGEEDGCEETGWFSSHPGGRERRAALEALIESR